MEEIQPQVKLPLNKFENRELRAYIFIGKSEDIWAMKEGTHIIFSYDLDRAVISANQSAPLGFFIKHIGTIPIKELFKMVETEQAMVFNKPEEKAIEKKTTKEQFVFNLLLAADEFVKDAEDKKKLLKIVQRLKDDIDITLPKTNTAEAI